MMNSQTLQGNWNQLKGQVKDRWGQLTDSELTQAEGDFQKLIGLIQRKTGQARDRIESELSRMMEEGAAVGTRATQAVREFAESAGDRAHQAYEQVSEQVRGGYEQAERVVQERPFESLAVAFGTGLIAGVIVGLLARSR
jgi:uncharacterized protein YjbJ (UPF0337 family)